MATRRRRAVAWVVLWVAIALLLTGLIWLGWRVVRVWGAAAALRSDLDRAQALTVQGPRRADPAEAASLVRAAREDLVALQRAADPFLPVAPRLGWVPRYGPTIAAAPALMDVAVDLAKAGDTTSSALLPLLTEADDGAGGDQGPFLGQVTDALVAAQPQLDEALALIEEARSAREKIDADRLVPPVRDRVDQLDRYLPVLERGVRLAQLAPKLLGAEGPRTYLILVQNEDELRATGGFISGVATLTVADGQMGEMTFQDSYAVDDFSKPYPDPPQPLREFMGADLWVFRDSNWSPDFPTAARKAVELFRISRDVQVDGVIAVDQHAISLLLGPLGPLQVEGATQPVTGQNVLEVARDAWNRDATGGADSWRHRKDIMGDVVDAAVERLGVGLDSDQMVDLGLRAVKALGEKHVLLFFEDSAAAAVARDIGWDGSLAAGSADVLAVIDTNVGFNKVNAVVEERLDYAVDLSDPARPRSVLRVEHRHRVEGWEGPCDQEPRYGATYEDLTRRCYYDYVRVYAPGGATLLGGTPHPVPGAILLSGQRRAGEIDVSRGPANTSVFSTFLVVRPGERVETTFEYGLPSAAVEHVGDDWGYRLALHKQPGTRAQPFSLTVHLPPGADLVSVTPSAAGWDGEVLTYATDLRTDLEIDVTWREGGGD